MGANATTFVPAYVSGEVLTAADLTVTNSGIPVFATTVTRDAAFGGTGEKTLAEGQTCYLEDSNIVQYYDGSSWATLAPTASAISAVASAQVLTSQSTTSTTYTDLSTAGPAVTLTTGTSALVLVMAGYATQNATGPGTVISFAVSGATTIAASDDFRGTLSANSAYNASSIVMLTKVTTLTAGSNTFTAKYKVTSASTGEYQNRSITVWAI
jgi:hypothetical protein